ncbi:MAG: hypothetical protein ACFWUD_05800 [Thermocaproicibacter melissae]|jgi:hypothetical protein
MTQGKNNTDLTELLLKCMAEPDPMLSMLEWLCAQLMEAEVSGLVGAEKNAHNPSRSDYRCGYRPRRLDTRVGTMYRSNMGSGFPKQSSFWKTGWRTHWLSMHSPSLMPVKSHRPICWNG